jgi:hypothetical protein
MAALEENIARLNLTIPVGNSQLVVDKFSSLIAQDVAVPVAAMNALVFCIKVIILINVLF